MTVTSSPRQSSQSKSPSHSGGETGSVGGNPTLEEDRTHQPSLPSNLKQSTTTSISGKSISEKDLLEFSMLRDMSFSPPLPPSIANPSQQYRTPSISTGKRGHSLPDVPISLLEDPLIGNRLIGQSDSTLDLSLLHSRTHWSRDSYWIGNGNDTPTDGDDTPESRERRWRERGISGSDSGSRSSKIQPANPMLKYVRRDRLLTLLNDPVVDNLSICHPCMEEFKELIENESEKERKRLALLEREIERYERERDDKDRERKEREREKFEEEKERELQQVEDEILLMMKEIEELERETGNSEREIEGLIDDIRVMERELDGDNTDSDSNGHCNNLISLEYDNDCITEETSDLLYAYNIVNAEMIVLSDLLSPILSPSLTLPIPLSPMYDELQIITPDTCNSTDKEVLGKDDRGGSSYHHVTPDTQSCTTTVVKVQEVYAVVQGQRLAFSPIPRLQLNWGEMNAAWCQYANMILSLRYLLGFTRDIDLLSPSISTRERGREKGSNNDTTNTRSSKGSNTAYVSSPIRSRVTSNDGESDSNNSGWDIFGLLTKDYCQCALSLSPLSLSPSPSVNTLSLPTTGHTVRTPSPPPSANTAFSLSSSLLSTSFLPSSLSPSPSVPPPSPSSTTNPIGVAGVSPLSSFIANTASNTAAGLSLLVSTFGGTGGVNDGERVSERERVSEKDRERERGVGKPPLFSPPRSNKRVNEKERVCDRERVRLLGLRPLGDRVLILVLPGATTEKEENDRESGSDREMIYYLEGGISHSRAPAIYSRAVLVCAIFSILTRIEVEREIERTRERRGSSVWLDSEILSRLHTMFPAYPSLSPKGGVLIQIAIALMLGIPIGLEEECGLLVGESGSTQQGKGREKGMKGKKNVSKGSLSPFRNEREGDREGEGEGVEGEDGNRVGVNDDDYCFTEDIVVDASLSPSTNTLKTLIESVIRRVSRSRGKSIISAFLSSSSSAFDRDGDYWHVVVMEMMSMIQVITTIPPYEKKFV